MKARLLLVSLFLIFVLAACNLPGSASPAENNGAADQSEKWRNSGIYFCGRE